MLKTFLPLFMMTFFICLFIVMMQFLWRYIDDLVGKGLGIGVISELFFYAALTMTPMALPLAILLASLMTFGNLGEHFELTAMKSAGISLIKVMRPLIVFIAFVSVGAFFFQNDVLPRAQVKMWTLLFSMRQKSPTLDIPEGAVYSQIPGVNLFVKKKNPHNDMLYNILIYDVRSGSHYPRIVSADSGSLSTTADKQHLVVKLYHGNQYEELEGGKGALGSNEMYRRESFRDKELYVKYDDNFTRMDDQTMRSQYVGKNLTELRHTIDSISVRVDSIGSQLGNELRSEEVMGVPTRENVTKNGKTIKQFVKPVAMARPVNFDSIVENMQPFNLSTLVSEAKNDLVMRKQNLDFKNFSMDEDKFQIRRHKIELQKKFTLSLACLIFFFIGAPLGAIIRKGGIGTPIVISVLLFIVYYIIDNMGYKLARDGHWPVWQGIWLSSAVLLPLGIFLTKKSVDDSAVFNPDAYRNFFRRLFGLHQVRKLALKEVIIEEVDTSTATQKLNTLKQLCSDFLNKYANRQGYLEYWQQGFDRDLLTQLTKELDDTVDYLSNSRNQLVLNKAMDFPVVRNLLTYHPVPNSKAGMAIAILLPIGIAGYLVGIRHQNNLRREIDTSRKVCEELITILNSGNEKTDEINVQESTTQQDKL